jgi:hypothetical protein
MLLTREAKPGYSSSKRQAAPSKGWFGGRHLGNPDQLLLAASCLTIARLKRKMRAASRISNRSCGRGSAMVTMDASELLVASD